MSEKIRAGMFIFKFGDRCHHSNDSVGEQGTTQAWVKVISLQTVRDETKHCLMENLIVPQPCYLQKSISHPGR